MAISKSRLGRGLGNLIAGGISNSNAKPSKPAAKAAPAKKPTPAAKPAAAKPTQSKPASSKSAKAPLKAKPPAKAKTGKPVKAASKPTATSTARSTATAVKTTTPAATSPEARTTAPTALPAASATAQHGSAAAVQPAPAQAHAAAASAANSTPAAATENTSPYREIAVSAVVPNPYQPRREMDPEHIAELANSIASEGLLQPIVVRPLEGGKSYELIAGERRWRAHQKLGLRTISARVMNASDSSSAVISLIENIQRQALNPIDEALGFASLMRDFDLTQEAVAERIGRARASIANALRLLSLDREVQGYVGKGLLSVGHAKILLGLEEPAQRVLVARRIIEGGMSVRETEDLVRRLKNEKHTRSSPVGSAAVSEADRTAIADLEKQLSSRLNTKVQLKHTPKKGRIVIEYYGNEDLQRILERTGLQL